MSSLSPQKDALSHPHAEPTEHIVLSRFAEANGMIEAVKEAFRRRPHLVDEVPGFLRMNVLTPVKNPTEIWLLTHWTDADSYRRWHHSHAYKDAHDGIPKGLKLVPGKTDISEFELVYR